MTAPGMDEYSANRRKALIRGETAFALTFSMGLECWPIKFNER